MRLITGLSPLARGTPRQNINAINNARFIPAGAGNTLLPVLPQARWPVYPRWRGEHSIASDSSHSEPGLSPLARGTRAHHK
ncbi:hypothetical protein SEEA0100_21021 [Salmonella enterica subsp. enterica serovar Anatum str. USDA 100]|nr:hypothetical protein SEEA0100_21021 [Salmonella enterica subsp. enterica serovar Anatum str. USDA 100]